MGTAAPPGGARPPIPLGSTDTQEMFGGGATVTPVIRAAPVFRTVAARLEVSPFNTGIVGLLGLTAIAGRGSSTVVSRSALLSARSPSVVEVVVLTVLVTIPSTSAAMPASNSRLTDSETGIEPTCQVSV